MGRIGLFLAVLAISGVGATVFFSAQSVHRRQLAHLREKERFKAEKIKGLVEIEDSRSSGVGAGRSKKAGIQALAASAAGAHGVCESIEPAGSGPDAVDVDPALWSEFMGEYHAAKSDLIRWVSANHLQFPEKLIGQMESEIRNSRVMRPQNQIEPDLTWRGVAAWTRPRAGTMDANERPALIHVGSGFLTLFKDNRARARFELSRMLAQAWSPCEMDGVRESAGWKGLLSCMGMSDDQVKCAPGAVSEATWAVSTAAASLVSNPGCQIPAFADEKSAACLKQFHRGDVVSYPIEMSVERKVASAAETGPETSDEAREIGTEKKGHRR